MEGLPRLDCFGLRPRNDGRPRYPLPVIATRLSLRASGILPSEVIPCDGLPRLDCFGLRPRNDGRPRYPLPVIAARLSLRA
ncbi:MAG: hypothetical protein LBT00_10175 [Spirochaetaceae bacterium]|nr:hypothetical protein [Spirochaetaceae bacterium]